MILSACFDTNCLRVVYSLYYYSPWIFSVCFGKNAAKKKRSCPFSSSKPRAKKKSKSEFDKEWAAKLAESDKGSFYQQEKWLEELDIQKSENAAVTESASCSKIQLEEQDEESQLSHAPEPP